MPFLRRLSFALTAFFYLRLYEILFGFFVLAIGIYFTRSISTPPDLHNASRLVFALEGPFAIIAIYYFLFGYIFASLLAVLILCTLPFFRRATLAATNALVYAVHGLCVMYSALHTLPLSIWAAWLSIVIFNALSPSFLPRRVFEESLRG
jgi:hypothetical protein